MAIPITEWRRQHVLDALAKAGNAAELQYGELMHNLAHAEACLLERDERIEELEAELLTRPVVQLMPPLQQFPPIPTYVPTITTPHTVMETTHASK